MDSLGLTRRQFLKASTGAAAATLGQWARVAASSAAWGWQTSKSATTIPKSFGFEAATPSTRNVLFIVVDDLNNSLGCYGHSVVKSPNIDRLAARGLRFDRAYCQFPVCNPSRTSFLTGLRPDSTGVLSNTVPFRSKLPDTVTLPQLFRQHGYFTARVGKIFHSGATMDDPEAWEVTSDLKGTPLGKKGHGRNLTAGQIRWCRWLAAEGSDEDQPDGQIAAEAVRLIQQQRDKPFFLAVGFHKPHDPFVAPKRYFDLYPLERLKPPEDPADRSAELPYAIGSGWKREFDRFTDRERREFMRAYYAGVSFMDAQVGKVMAALDSLQLWRNTIVVLLGDHGYHLGERGWWNKNTLFELSARAPLIFVTPETSDEGSGCSRIVEFVDIYPTLADLCGLPSPANLEGTSLRPLLSDPTRPWKMTAFTQVQRGRIVGRSVRTQRWRYTEWDEGREGAELYDHDSDPGEYHNLAGDAKYAQTIAEMRELLRRSRN
jgi:iduronate 2-sulfatase